MNHLFSLFYPQINKNRVYFWELDLFRVAAVFMVIFFHATLLYTDYYVHENWPKLTNPFLSFWYEGHAGVDLLFILTGFLLTVSFINKKFTIKNLIKYFIRRAKRILPLYFASIMTALIIVPSPDLSLSTFLPYLFFFTNLPVHIAFLSPFNAVYWAITVEVHFSLIFPLITGFIKKTKFLLLLIVLVLIPKILMPTNLTYLSSVYGRIDQFIVGMILANVCFKSNIPGLLAKRKSLLIFMIISLVILLWFFLLNLNYLGGYLVNSSYQSYYHSLEALIWALLILFVFSANLKMHLPFAEVIQQIGDKRLFYNLITALSTISYSMFIWHFPLASYIIKWQKLNGFVASESNIVINTLLIILPLTILVSAISYLIIEKPFLKTNH